METFEETIVRLNNVLAGVLISGAIESTAAHAEDRPGNVTIGKVDRVYVREFRGLYIEKKLLRHNEGKELWVDVRDPATAASQTIGEMFKVPADLAIERGDLVATRYGDESGAYLNLIPTPNKVTQLVARHDTLMAMMFGLPKSSPMVKLFLNAKAQ
jgi:hypothetical protein